MPINFSGTTNITGSQIIDTVEGDAVMNSGLSADEVVKLLESVQELAEANGFNDPVLNEICGNLESNEKKGSEGILARLGRYVSNLDTLNKAGELVAKYGPGAVPFLVGLKALLPL